MSKKFIIVASDSGNVEIIRKEDLLKVYLVLPDANSIAFCWYDRIRERYIETRYTPEYFSEEGCGRALRYFERVSDMLCEKHKHPQALQRIEIRNALNKFRNSTTEDKNA